MYRLKHETVFLDAGLVGNNNLSFGARGLLIYLLAKPSGQFYFNELAEAIQSDNAESVDHLVDLMIEIAQAGFVHFESGELIVTEYAKTNRNPEEIPLLVREMRDERRRVPGLSLREKYKLKMEQSNSDEKGA